MCERLCAGPLGGLLSAGAFAALLLGVDLPLVIAAGLALSVLLL